LLILSGAGVDADAEADADASTDVERRDAAGRFLVRIGGCNGAALTAAARAARCESAHVLARADWCDVSSPSADVADAATFAGKGSFSLRVVMTGRTPTDGAALAEAAADDDDDDDASCPGLDAFRGVTCAALVGMEVILEKAAAGAIAVAAFAAEAEMWSGSTIVGGSLCSSWSLPLPLLCLCLCLSPPALRGQAALTFALASPSPLLFEALIVAEEPAAALFDLAASLSMLLLRCLAKLDAEAETVILSIQLLWR